MADGIGCSGRVTRAVAGARRRLVMCCCLYWKGQPNVIVSGLVSTACRPSLNNPWTCNRILAFWDTNSSLRRQTTAEPRALLAQEPGQTWLTHAARPAAPALDLWLRKLLRLRLKKSAAAHSPRSPPPSQRSRRDCRWIGGVLPQGLSGSAAGRAIQASALAGPADRCLVAAGRHTCCARLMDQPGESSH